MRLRCPIRSTAQRILLRRSRSDTTFLGLAGSSAGSYGSMGSAQLAVVTGASSGIGLELARLFASDGYDLVVVADEPAIEDTAKELADAGGQVESVQVDLRDAGAVQHV